MKIVVIGATGNVGSRFAAQAASAGHDVLAYARTPERVVGVPAVAGAAEDTAALTAALAGADALLVSITGKMTDGTFMQRTLPSVIDAARASGVGRVVLVSVFGAGGTAALASGGARLVYKTALHGFLRDKAAADRLLEASGLEWTIAYPVNLKDAASSGFAVAPLEDVTRVPGMPTLPFDDAAAALLQVVTTPATSSRRVLITTPTGWR